MRKKKQSRKEWEQEMKDRYDFWCIDYIKSHNITLVAVCYNVVTLKIYGIWRKS